MASRPAIALATAALLLSGQARAETGQPPERESEVIVYGDDPCPQSSEEEVVICARKPESERYRIPKELRSEGGRPSEVAWGARVETLDEVARGSRPGSCSVVGTAGQTGCLEAFLRQWLSARRTNGGK